MKAIKTDQKERGLSLEGCDLLLSDVRNGSELVNLLIGHSIDFTKDSNCPQPHHSSDFCNRYFRSTNTIVLI